jgi:hypothetical protein
MNHAVCQQILSGDVKLEMELSSFIPAPCLDEACLFATGAQTDFLKASTFTKIWRQK